MPEDHPDPRLLERFMRNEVAGEERRWIVRHLLAGCARCGTVTRRLWALGEPGPEAAPERGEERGNAEAAFLEAYRRLLGEGRGTEAAAALLGLAALYAREGRAAEILPFARDLLPLFRTPELRKGVAAALVCFRSLAESGRPDADLLAAMARYVGPAS